MVRRAPEGYCRLCREWRLLSYEHVPPESAFNDQKVWRLNFEQAIQYGPNEQPKGKQQQRGQGEYTLCERCNFTAGRWYVPSFTDWCVKGMRILDRSSGNVSLPYVTSIRPLPIIKQIVVMFFSINGLSFGAQYPELMPFVLNRGHKGLPGRYRFFVYFNIEGIHRLAPISARLDVHTETYATRKPLIMSELSFPPYGYLMTVDSEPPDRRLFEITHFVRYEDYDYADMQLHLLPLPTYMGFPGDYRSEREIYEQYAANADYIPEPPQ